MNGPHLHRDALNRCESLSVCEATGGQTTKMKVVLGLYLDDMRENFALSVDCELT
jgi:hypothetical protein